MNGFDELDEIGGAYHDRTRVFEAFDVLSLT